MCAFKQCFEHILMSFSFSDSRKAMVTCINPLLHDKNSVKDTFHFTRGPIYRTARRATAAVVLGTNENVSVVSSTGAVDISLSLSVKFGIGVDLFASSLVMCCRWRKCDQLMEVVGVL